MIHYKEVNVTGSSGGSPWDVARTLELMAAREIDAGDHIARIGDLAHTADFLEMIKAQVIDGKAVVYPAPADQRNPERTIVDRPGRKRVAGGKWLAACGWWLVASG